MSTPRASPPAPITECLLLNNSRPDATYQINPTWQQFQYDLKVKHKACLLHVAQGDFDKQGNDRIADKEIPCHVALA